jgi:hypothetical protein
MPVRLKLAFNQNYAVSGMTFNWTTLFAKVSNLAFDKQVDLVYSPFGSSAWLTKPLGFISHHGNYDVFGSDSVSLSMVETFALRYRAAGVEYWDNNFGANYTIGSAFSGKVGGHVCLRSAAAFRKVESGGGFTFDTGWFEGEILVDNLAFNKRVGVAYSRDGGATWNNVDGAYLGAVGAVASNVSGVEVWKFKTPQLNIEPGSDNYRFAVFFEVTDWGVSYWDNNFGQDYFLPKAAGSTLA